MKPFKFFLFISLLFSLIFSMHAAQDDCDLVNTLTDLKLSCMHAAPDDPGLKDALEALKLRFPVFQNSKFPNGRPLPTEQDLVELEGALLRSPWKLPDSLREFYKAVGNLRLPLFIMKTPHGGAQSSLYYLIREGHDKGLPKEWLSFCQCDGNDWFCMNLMTGRIRQFTFLPQVEGHDEYKNLSTWIKRWWLSSSS